MIITACVDNSMGMIFNNRRLSQDRYVTDRLLKITQGKRLLISSFSKDLFEDTHAEINDQLLKIANKDDYCFIENIIPDNFKDVDKIILFFWNRDYPYDLSFELPDNFTEVLRQEFKGYSHDKITEVHYEKNV